MSTEPSKDTFNFEIFTRPYQTPGRIDINNPDTEIIDVVIRKLPIRTYIANHRGVWIGGCSVVQAHTIEQARALLNEKLEEVGLQEAIAEGYELTELPDEPIVIVLFDGDY